ncbi:hypothetical protein [Corynebacterium tuscaniense]|uniref:hypothetical protein n=1 Tax=Corynebacterium tuscaniense TaxID=302449 RepID=UPI00123AF957|nr:hypothetical protein [Corynebacterium tuscaniense]KAA8744837.1 hypothetical protein F4V54_01840 [Corynebacterium tuscaniense]
MTKHNDPTKFEYGGSLNDETRIQDPILTEDTRTASIPLATGADYAESSTGTNTNGGGWWKWLLGAIALALLGWLIWALVTGSGEQSSTEPSTTIVGTTTINVTTTVAPAEDAPEPAQDVPGDSAPAEDAPAPVEEAPAPAPAEEAPASAN